MSSFCGVPLFDLFLVFLKRFFFFYRLSAKEKDVPLPFLSPSHPSLFFLLLSRERGGEEIDTIFFFRNLNSRIHEALSEL